MKWFIIDSDYKNNRNQSNDVPIFRYADILLEKAEAITRGAKATNGDTPQSLFNQIRAYVHAPLLDHQPSLSEILEERGRELFDENWRRNDMIRFGTFESEYGFHKKDSQQHDSTRNAVSSPSLKARSNRIPTGNRTLDINVGLPFTACTAYATHFCGICRAFLWHVPQTSVAYTAYRAKN